ncbi:hypothetical protein BGX28_001395, partial [Mortierella sp. GBA30]
LPHDIEDVLTTAFGYGENISLPQLPQESDEARFTVKWDQSIPEHCALNRIFKEENIPLLEDSDEIDYSKIKKRTFQGAPVLDLDVSKIDTADMVQEIATRVVTFPLSKVGLAKDYTQLINKMPMKERTWKQVVVCLSKALKFELLEAYLADKVLTMRPKAGETFLAFSQCVKPILEAAQFADNGCSLLIKALGNHISDIGFQATLKEYGSFIKVTSMQEYLEFLSNTPGALDGSKTNHANWFIKKYGGKSGAQAVERTAGKEKSEQSVLASLQGKRSGPAAEKNQGNKKHSPIDIPF